MKNPRLAHSWIISTVVMLATAGMATPGLHAQAILYDPGPGYLQASNSPFHVPSLIIEDFEDGLLNAPGVTEMTGTALVQTPAYYCDSVDADDGVIDGSGAAGHSLYANGSGMLEFMFDSVALGTLPTLVGLVLTDTSGQDVGFVINAFDGANVQIGTITGTFDDSGAFTGQTDEDRFFGFEHSLGIYRITIQVAVGNGIFEIDHLQYSTATNNDQRVGFVHNITTSASSRGSLGAAAGWILGRIDGGEYAGWGTDVPGHRAITSIRFTVQDQDLATPGTFACALFPEDPTNPGFPDFAGIVPLSSTQLPALGSGPGAWMVRLSRVNPVLVPIQGGGDVFIGF
ncbi:MAG: hypothetical protein KDC98_06240, partial [Planctomycetes bacterium]|nr:hypothetical protein [Planctomycetota bacterium]